MTSIPPILLAGVYAQVLPPLALLAGRARTLPARLVAGSFFLSLATDLIAQYIGHRYGNNMWVSLVSAACFTSLLLWAYAEWQVTAVERLAFRIAVAPFLLVFAVLVFTLDGWVTFPRYSYPFSTLINLGGALWTLLRRTYTPSPVPLLQTDWFPILLGVALNAAIVTVTSPIGAVLMRYQRPDLVIQIWELRAVLVILTLLLITIGMLLPPAPRQVQA